MALNKTQYLRKKVLDHALGRIAFTMPTEVWLALFSASPTDEGLFTDELSQSGYARVSITAKMTDTVLASGQSSNNTEIVFGPAGEDWPEITYAAVVDSATIGAGNMLYFGAAVTSRIVESGDDFRIQIGQLTITET